LSDHALHLVSPVCIILSDSFVTHFLSEGPLLCAHGCEWGPECQKLEWDRESAGLSVVLASGEAELNGLECHQLEWDCVCGASDWRDE